MPLHPFTSSNNPDASSQRLPGAVLLMGHWRPGVCGLAARCEQPGVSAQRHNAAHESGQGMGSGGRLGHAQVGVSLGGGLRTHEDSRA